MIVYWKVSTKEIEMYDQNKNPIFYVEERFGEIVGSFSNEGGTIRNMFVVALNNGDFDSIEINKCYHKSEINDKSL